MENAVQLEVNDKKGFFYIAIDEKIAAKMTFVFAGPNKIIIDHTEVNEAFKGKNFGKKMVAQAVEFARENNIVIIPLCPFAKKVFDKTPEFKDVL
ncbi:GNAT family N-acetyltransferase [Flavobacterium cellulosilyticum]|uniref:N-acetyltransferase n=1 Tax=Flavobacterium cellulosilyticum TaxID=2541731 RepID=A0A4R5C610_9FLAO|nr:GNAT family N-acetyltransferase [Flavobacterium cellulosilyticum]TDD93976.1 N-acetyltransferase [Flavobacterium cellulosilyticum]